MVCKAYAIKVSKKGNVVAHQAIYNKKELDEGSKILKARIAHQGSKGNEKFGLKTNSGILLSIDIRRSLSLCVTFWCRL